MEAATQTYSMLLNDGVFVFWNVKANRAYHRTAVTGRRTHKEKFSDLRMTLLPVVLPDNK